jgi:NADH:ubiquinone oxidoreductase subunit 2 (subunit N)
MKLNPSGEFGTVAFITAVLLISLLSMAEYRPAGFIGKFYHFASIVNQEMCGWRYRHQKEGGGFRFL